jgi:hypothetical protein
MKPYTKQVGDCPDMSHVRREAKLNAVVLHDQPFLIKCQAHRDTKAEPIVWKERD